MDVPPPQTFTRDTYRRAYHDPADDWGREGGVLRCDADGKNPELIARGLRNPWDIGFDSEFNWLGTDNDQNEGDRVFAPFRGAHFGWNHPWSAGWSSVAEPHITPVCGPLFQGSGTGVVFGDSEQFPAHYRGVWFINDWLRKTMLVFRPSWDSATRSPAGGTWEEFVRGGSSLFRPVDLEFGPDGALWCLGWSRGYGAEYEQGAMTNEGRIYRIAWKDARPPQATPAQRGRSLAECPVDELLGDFTTTLPVWRTAAQEELVRRGAAVRAELQAALEGGRLSPAQETWTAWALGRIAPEETGIDDFFAGRLTAPAAGLNAKVQALRILAHRASAGQPGRPLPQPATAMLASREPRLRFEAVQALGAASQPNAWSALTAVLAGESDRTVFYAAWQTLRALAAAGDLKSLLRHEAGGVRRGALLALLEDHGLTPEEAAPLANDTDPLVRKVAALWIEKTSAGVAQPVVRGRPLGGDGAAAAADAPPPTGVVRRLQARSGSRYALAPGGLRAGGRHFTDTRDYGVFVANPFGRAAMKQGAASAVTVKRGESLTLRFGAALHAGAPGQRVDPAALYRAFAAPSGPEPKAAADPQ